MPASSARATVRLLVDGDGQIVSRHGDLSLLGEDGATAFHLRQLQVFRQTWESLLKACSIVGDVLTLRLPGPGASLAADVRRLGTDRFELVLSPTSRGPRARDEDEVASFLPDALDIMGIGVVVAGAEGHGSIGIRHANAAAASILGLPSDGADQGEGFVVRALESEQYGFTTWRRPDGVERHLKVHVDRRRVAGRPSFVLVFQDATVQYRREKNLQRLLDELEAKNENLQAFSRSMAHDLKNPVLSMAMLAEQLLEEGMTDDQARACHGIAEAGRRVLDLIDHLLCFVRLGETVIRKVPVDIDPLLDAVRIDLSATCRQRGATVTSAVEACPSGEPELIRLLLQNLVANGIHHNSSPQPKVHVESAHIDGRIVLRVSDNGWGIPPGEEERVFRPFERIPGHEARPGTGLGLSICRRIAHLHGATIHVVPASMGGTSFEVRFPRNREHDLKPVVALLSGGQEDAPAPPAMASFSGPP